MSDGGCLCGAVRYRAEGAPLVAGYCHCRMCQRAAGAPVVAWGIWPAGSFAWLSGAPARYASSARGERVFCPVCGTLLAFLEAETVDVTLASLDEPAAVAPREHIWTASRLPWFELADALPRYEGWPPQDPPGG
jgi:hypothetical protein